MKRMLLTAALVLGFYTLPCRSAVPVQDMSALSLAGEYYGALHGHYALYDFDSSALAAHFLRLHYSPVRWLRLTGGVGGSRAYASPSIEGAKTGLALTGGGGLYTPRLLRLFSFTAGYEYLYMTAKEKSVTYRSRVVPHINPATGAAAGFDTLRYVGSVKEGATAAFIHAPSAGVIFHLGRFADCEVGGVYHYFDVAKKERTVTNTEYDDEGAAVTVPVHKTIGKDGDFTDQVRLYAAVTLHERGSGAFIAGGAGYALTNGVENNNTILPNFSFWWQVGLIMRDPRDARGDGFRYGRRGGAYEELKVREERMAEALDRGSERLGPRRHGGGPRRGGNRGDKGASSETAGETDYEDDAETEAGSVEADVTAIEE